MVEIPVSLGELIDKITILFIKRKYINDFDKLRNVNQEYDLLITKWKSLKEYSEESLGHLVTSLANVNERIWFVEDAIRDHERRQDFGEDFIKLARSVYTLNDERANIKRQINLRLGSQIYEEKSYAKYKD